jgi:fluoroacetyl-CoA thioesterase
VRDPASPGPEPAPATDQEYDKLGGGSRPTAGPTGKPTRITTGEPMDTPSASLAPGLKHAQSVTVTEEMTPPHLRAEPIRVLATPEMVRMVEQTAIQAVQPLLPSGQTTVGTRVDIAHLAGTPEGMRVTIEVELTGIDRRRLTFRFEVHDEVEKVAEGTHDRFIVDGAQRLPRLQAKVDAWRKR